MATPSAVSIDALIEQTVAQVEDAVAAEHGEELLAAAHDSPWREEPVDLRAFVTSREHLNLPPLFKLQYEAMEALLGTDPKRIFEAPDLSMLDPDAAAKAQRAAAKKWRRIYQLAVLLWGKGSGKDYLCSVIVAYLVYVLLCLRDPRGYLELAPGENIDILNVAYNSDQAKKVFFTKFKERLYRWRWLRQGFDVHEAGRRKWTDNAGLPKVEINDGEVIFPRGIRCLSKHSQNESYEGLNIIAWVMDEASAFLSAAKKENAGAIYQTLRTSAGSRFGLRWVGFIISYPRHADDFTMQKVREARANPQAGIYADGPRATWEVNELRGRDGMVEVRPGHKVPVELANDYTLDYEEALAKYECKPPLAKDALIKDHARVWAAVQRGLRPLIEWEPLINVRTVINGKGEEERREYAGVRLTRMGPLPKNARLFLHGDPARTNDSFVIALGYGVPATVMVHVPAGEVLTARQLAEQGLDATDVVQWERDVTRTVIAGVLVWKPDPKVNRHVDQLNVDEVLLALIDHYGRRAIGAVTFDQYDSAKTVQQLETRKVPVENEQWSNALQHRIYRGARSALYNDLVTLPDTPSVTSQDDKDPGVVYELLRVEEIDGHKIDHPEGGSKDLADAVVRVIEHVSGEARKAFSFGSVATAAKAEKLGGATKRVDPQRTPSPVTPAMRAADEQRREQRPEGELEPATARQGGGRLGFGSIRGGR